MGNKLEIKKSLAKRPEGFECHGLKYPPTFSAAAAGARTGRDAAERRRNRKRMSVSTSGDEWLNFRHPIDNIVLSGGGSKGYAFVGALKALEDCGALGRLRRIGGSSVGAICAGLCAVGCSPQEIADVFSPNVKWLFHDQECMPITCLPNIWKKFGINPASRFYEIYGAHIEARLGSPDLTFAQLYEKTGRELCIVVTNLTKMRSEYFHPKTTPDVPIRLAVRMSMSFPVVFQPIQYTVDGTESWFTDGGTLDNYPVHIFDGTLLDMNHNWTQSDEGADNNPVVPTNRDDTADPSVPSSPSPPTSRPCPALPTIGAAQPGCCCPSPGRPDKVNTRTLGMYVVSESPMDQYIWKTLFGTRIPYKPTYVPDTKLAKQRLKDDHPKQKRKKLRFLSKRKRAAASAAAAGVTKSLESVASVAGWPPECVTAQMEQDTQQIKHFGDFVLRTIEMLLVHQRQLKIKSSDVHRTIPINCGYIGTNDYDIETGDREFMLRQGYECTKKFLIEFMERCEQQEAATPSSPDAANDAASKDAISDPSDACMTTAVEVTAISANDVNDVVDASDATTVVNAVSTTTEVLTTTECHMNNSDSSDSGFCDGAASPGSDAGRIVKIEITTTTTDTRTLRHRPRRVTNPAVPLRRTGAEPASEVKQSAVETAVW